MAFAAIPFTALGSALGASAATATLTGVAATAMGVQLLSTIQSGRAQSQATRLQASQAQLQGRQNALAYNRQALQVLERQERLAGTIRARAAAAGVDPFTGSPLTMQQFNALAAGREAQIAQENAEMAIYGGLAQSQSLRSAASLTQTQAITGALSTAALQSFGLSKTATPGTQTLAPVETASPRMVGVGPHSTYTPATSFPVR